MTNTIFLAPGADAKTLSDVLRYAKDNPDHKLDPGVYEAAIAQLGAIPDPTRLDGILTMTKGIMDLRDRSNDPSETYDPVTLPPHLIRNLNKILEALYKAQTGNDFRVCL